MVYSGTIISPRKAGKMADELGIDFEGGLLSYYFKEH